MLLYVSATDNHAGAFLIFRTYCNPKTIHINDLPTELLDKIVVHVSLCKVLNTDSSMGGAAKPSSL